MSREFSKIKESLASWSEIRQLLRGGEQGQLVPVVIPKDRRGFSWMILVFLAVYFAGMAVMTDFTVFAALAALFFLAVALLTMWRRAIIEIEEGTAGVGCLEGPIGSALPPGRHYRWLHWDRVDAVVDTWTEIPYSAPIVACPTAESVPLKSIEFFLKFRIVDPVAFVRTIGAGNFDL